jgi:hypothetical protein
VALLKSLEVDAKPIDQPIRPNDDPIVLRFGVGGNETGVLGRGWQENEDGGRWTDGAVASLLLPAAWINPRPYLEVSFVQDHRGFTLDLRYGGKSVPPVSSGVNEILFHLDLSKDRSSDEYSELEIVASSTFCPEDEGLSDDPRVLGVFVKSLKLFSHPPDDRKTFRNGGLSLRKRIASLLR